jgi:hypothetical protein
VQEKTGNTLEAIGISKDFLWNPSNPATKRKDGQMGPHKIEKLLHNKRNASYTSDKELLTKTYRELKKLNFPQINDSIKKWVKKHRKKFSPSLAIKEMQIKNTLRFQLTPVRIATIKNTNNRM